MAHLTHVYGENTEAVYVDGKLFAVADGVLPTGVLLSLLIEQKIKITTVEFHAEVTLADSNQFPEDVASLVTMLKVS